MEHKRIPVTILTGFLGAGKTTALNHLIQNHPNTKFAIIENEFGDIAIDNDLVIDADSDIFELSNGCICCTLNGELVETLRDLVEGDYIFDHLIIETTGIAEPDGVAAAFVSEPAVQQYFQLDATICMVDAHHAAEALREREEAKRQVTFADHLVINKASEVSVEVLHALKAQLQQANPLASLELCDQGKLASGALQLQAYDQQRVQALLSKERHAAHNEPGHVCDDHCDHDHHHSDIVTQSFVLKAPLDVLKFRHWLNVLLMIQGKHLYRVKGIIDFQYQDQKTILQSVKQMCVFSSGGAWSVGEERESRIVFIGKHLKRDVLQKQLNHCMAQPVT